MVSLFYYLLCTVIQKEMNGRTSRLNERQIYWPFVQRYSLYRTGVERRRKIRRKKKNNATIALESEEEGKRLKINRLLFRRKQLYISLNICYQTERKENMVRHLQPLFALNSTYTVEQALAIKARKDRRRNMWQPTHSKPTERKNNISTAIYVLLRV